MKVVIEIPDSMLRKFCEEAQCTEEEAQYWIKHDFENFKKEYFGLTEN